MIHPRGGFVVHAVSPCSVEYGGGRLCSNKHNLGLFRYCCPSQLQMRILSFEEYSADLPHAEKSNIAQNDCKAEYPRS